jgi:hypothetical protein
VSETSIFLICVFILIILFVGDPDLMDTIIKILTTANDTAEVEDDTQ